MTRPSSGALHTNLPWSRTARKADIKRIRPFVLQPRGLEPQKAICHRGNLNSRPRRSYQSSMRGTRCRPNVSTSIPLSLSTVAEVMVTPVWPIAKVQPRTACAPPHPSCLTQTATEEPAPARSVAAAFTCAAHQQCSVKPPARSRRTWDPAWHARPPPLPAGGYTTQVDGCGTVRPTGWASSRIAISRVCLTRTPAAEM